MNITLKAATLMVVASWQHEAAEIAKLQEGDFSDTLLERYMGFDFASLASALNHIKEYIEEPNDNQALREALTAKGKAYLLKREQS